MSLRAALLGLLSEGPSTGYELVRDFDVAASVIWPAPKGEIYRELARLQAQGFAIPDEKAGVRNRRKWQSTVAGRAELKRGRLIAQTDIDARRRGMLERVRQRLLHDPVRRQLDRRRQRANVALDAYLDCEIGVAHRGHQSR